jgi:hypothetical protein
MSKGKGKRVVFDNIPVDWFFLTEMLKATGTYEASHKGMEFRRTFSDYDDRVRVTVSKGKRDCPICNPSKNPDQRMNISNAKRCENCGCKLRKDELYVCKECFSHR